LDATDTPLHGAEARFFHGYYNHYCYLRCTFSAATSCCVSAAASNIDASAERRRTATDRRADSESLAAYEIICERIRVLP